jgi:hypothetical protein
VWHFHYGGLHTRISCKGIEFVQDYLDDLPISISGDAVRKDKRSHVQLRQLSPSQHRRHPENMQRKCQPSLNCVWGCDTGTFTEQTSSLAHVPLKLSPQAGNRKIARRAGRDIDMKQNPNGNLGVPRKSASKPRNRALDFEQKKR